MNQQKKYFTIILLVILGSVWFFQPLTSYLKLPKNLVVFKGEQVPVFKGMHSSNDEVVKIHHRHNKVLNAIATQTGNSEIVYTVAGIPVKKTSVKVLEDFRVIPGGHSIGVSLNSKGVLVVGYHLVDTHEGKQSPAEIANIQIGDIITKINDKAIEEMSDLTPIVQQAGTTGEALHVQLSRNNNHIKTVLKPLKGKGDENYKIGLYIRDSAAGIGTLTFIDPASRRYGALGHMISDSDTKMPIQVDKGLICKSYVTAIQKGASGVPGEKLARFSENQNILGVVHKNSPFGIFGKMYQESITTEMQAIPIGLSSQVKEGPATILSVIENEKVEAFEVEIISSVPQKVAATKGLVIKITDKRLLEKTGGIVQGMSGSPIIQNGRLIGAVTHVFVNDPTSGYGVHIEWMLQEAGINIYTESKQKKAS